MKEIIFEKTKINRILVSIHLIVTILMILNVFFIPFVIMLYITRFAYPLIISSSIIFVSFVLTDEQAHLCSYGFWINILGNLIFLVFLFPNITHIQYVFLLILSLINIGISALLLFYRHEIDKIVITGLVKVEESFNKLDLKTIKSKIPLYRIKRSIQRGIRAEYLDPNFIIDKDILLKCPEMKIRKEILYKKTRSPNVWEINGVQINIYGVSLIGLSFLWYIIYHIFFDFTHIIFGVNFTIGAFIITYHAVQSLHHRKTILIIDHWLRWKNEIDLSNLGTDYGYLPINYSPRQLVDIVTKYKKTGVFGNIEINNFKIRLVKKDSAL